MLFTSLDICLPSCPEMLSTNSFWILGIYRITARALYSRSECNRGVYLLLSSIAHESYLYLIFKRSFKKVNVVQLKQFSIVTEFLNKTFFYTYILRVNCFGHCKLSFIITLFYCKVYFHFELPWKIHCTETSPYSICNLRRIRHLVALSRFWHRLSLIFPFHPRETRLHSLQYLCCVSSLRLHSKSFAPLSSNNLYLR